MGWVEVEWGVRPTTVFPRIQSGGVLLSTELRSREIINDWVVLGVVSRVQERHFHGLLLLATRGWERAIR